MNPYKLRERLKKDVPTVGIFPVLTNPDYSEEEYQEILQEKSEKYLPSLMKKNN